MQLDLGTLCIFGVILIVAVFVLPRLMNGMRGGNYSQRGPESPRYDDPNIQSRGGFGRGGGIFGNRNRGSESRSYDSPDVQSRGGFGGSRSSSSSSSRSSSSRSSGSGGASKSYNSPKVQSKGGFGGSKRK